MATSSSHPTAQELIDFARGKVLDDHQLVGIEAHLQDCVRCQQTVAEATPDAFMQAVGEAKARSPIVDRRLVEGYELLERIGAGGAGVVYRARQPGLDREVAIKVLRSGVTASAAELKRWRRETRTLAALNHAHIVKIFDAGEQTGTPFIAMELVQGQTLAEHLRGTPLSAREAATLVRDLASAMDYAHARGIIHRDLKPGNVLVPDPGQLGAAKIADFGLSRWLEEESHTRTGDALGTPSYMAPEQVRGQQDQIGPSVDVYGLGAVLYECLTGRPPFHGASAMETMQLVLERDAAPISRHRVAVPQDLDAICVRCLEKDPTRRYATADALREDLDCFLTDRPVVARKPSRRRLARLWIQRNPWLASFAALLFFALAIGASALLWHQHSLNQQRATAHRHYGEARATIWAMLDEAKSRSALDIPKLGEMALQQAERALDLFERLAAEEHSEGSQRELARIRLDLGTLYLTQGRNDEGRAQLQQAVDAMTELADPDSLEQLSEALSGQVKLAVALINAQRYDEAAELLVNAREIGVRLVDRDAENVSWLNNLAWVDHTEGSRQWHQRQIPSAKAAYERAVTRREAAQRLAPTNHELSRLLIESRLSLAQCRTQLGELEAAREVMQTAIHEIDELNAQTQPELTRQVARATALLNLSDIQASLEGPATAVTACSEGIESLQAFFDAEPNHAAIRQTLFQLHGNRGMYRMSAQQPEPGIGDWEMAVALAPDDELKGYCQTMRIRCLTMADQVDAAVIAAEQLEGSELSSDNVFRLAAAWGGLANYVRDVYPQQYLPFAIRSARSLGRLHAMEPLDTVTGRSELFANSDDFGPARLLLLPIACR
ncbi:MAG: protein kinase [Planctomycetota bacterium]